MGGGGVCRTFSSRDCYLSHFTEYTQLIAWPSLLGKNNLPTALSERVGRWGGGGEGGERRRGGGWSASYCIEG